MGWLKGICTAFSLYSALPMPQFAWNKQSMRHAMGFLPLVGAVLGAAQYAWLHLATRWGLHVLLYAAIAVALSVWLTGGIHLDGFLDSCDAFCSFGDREKKLAILKDPHVGAFGVIHAVTLCCVQLGLYAQLYETGSAFAVWSLFFVLSRVMGGSMVAFWPLAKKDGLAYTFADAGDKVGVGILLAVFLGVGLAGYAVQHALWTAVLALVLLALYGSMWRVCKRQLGGATGDLAGFTIVLAETLALAVCVLSGLLSGGTT